MSATPTIHVWINATDENIDQACDELQNVLKSQGEQHWYHDDYDSGELEYTCFVATPEPIQKWLDEALTRGLITEGRIEDEEQV